MPPPDRPRPSGFAKLLAAASLSNLGDGVFLVALPLVAADLTRSPAAVAGVTAAMRLPWLVFSLVAGAVVDRADRRVLMWRTDAVRTMLLAVLAGTVATETLSLASLYAIALALGTAETLRDNAAQAILPALVGRDGLERANGRLFAAETVTNQFAGPPLGGFLVAAGAAWAFAFNAATFAAAAGLVAAIGGGFAATRTAARRRMAAEIGEGLGWLWRHPTLRTLALLLGTYNLLGTAAFAVVVLFAQDVLGVGDVGFGVLFTGGAAGSVVGGLTVARLAGRLGRARVLVGSAVVIGAAQLAQGLVSDAWVFGGLFVVSGYAVVAWNVVTVSLRQALIPDELLGRVNSVYRFFGWGAMPLGAMLGGALAEVAGLRAPFVAGGAAAIAATLLGSRRLLAVDSVPTVSPGSDRASG